MQSRLRDTDSAVAFASHAGEILEKARIQLREGARTIWQLRQLLSGKHVEDVADTASAPKTSSPAYRVRFLNEFACAGSVVRACQRTITIRSARSPERAVEAAKKRFTRLEGIRHWRIRAQFVELEVIGADIHRC